MPLAPPESLDDDQILDELSDYLRPPGQGIFAISTGKAELTRRTREYLGRDVSAEAWREHVGAVRGVTGADRVAILAIPSDCGAGIVRGAARGPEAIRAAFGTAPAFDLGDVLSVPHFIEDAMLSEEQRRASQADMYPHREPSHRQTLPVSPLDMAQRVVRLVKRLCPGLRILMLGGDHTVTEAIMAAELRGPPEAMEHTAIVHFDAHTDLLPERLGVRACFATWAYHANERLGRGGRLLQLGIRASGHDRAHWEENLDVRQVWASEARALGPEGLADLVQDHLQRIGARRVYISNDLDGTDAYWASACGTPEPDGLEPQQVHAVIDRLKHLDVDVFGADVVELAPGLSLDREASDRSVQTATAYARSSLEVLRSRSAADGT